MINTKTTLNIKHMARRFTWKVWLLPNLMTKDVPNDNIADVSTAGHTKHNEDIARQIVEERSELRYETILGVLSERDAIERKYLLKGFSVQTGNVHLSPRVRGNWVGADPLFDHHAHKITMDATPTADMRKALEEEVGVEVLGKKADGGARIGLVTDTTTGKTDGTVTPGGSITIDGVKIKVAPAGEAGTGVFFVAADGTETQDNTPPVVNEPKRIICRVPALPAGMYTLQIRTRYTHGGNEQLKQTRTINYEIPLTVL
jgi:hypothetical protein